MILLAVAAFMLSGCSLGSRSLLTSRSDYNHAVQRSADEQMLLNLVRLKFRDSPMFLAVSSVVSQMSYTANLSGTSNFAALTKPSGSLSSSLGFSESPVVTFSPLEGEQFTKQLLTPIALERITLLYHSGWSVERLLRICVQRLNDLRNAPPASGPTPFYPPVFATYKEATRILRELQINDQIDLRFGKMGEETLPILVKTHSSGNTEWQRLLALLNDVPNTKETFFLTQDPQMVKKGLIYVETRSLLGVLFFLSQSVEVSEQDKRAGRVTITTDKNGAVFDWGLVTEGLFQVQSSAGDPGDKAAVSVFYRGRWYFIADTDLESKSTFSLLHQLFSLQAYQNNPPPPALTMPLGH